MSRCDSLNVSTYLHPQLALPVERVEGDGPQQDAFSEGAQQIVCFFGEQHEESRAAFAASSLRRPVRFSGTSPLVGCASSGDADVRMMVLLSVRDFLATLLASSSKDGGGAKKTQLWA